jgi:hypothetical protein
MLNRLVGDELHALDPLHLFEPEPRFVVQPQGRAEDPEPEMLDDVEDRSARRFVPYVSHGTLRSLEIWLRGRATDCTGSSVGWRRE